ncbi:MAG: zinc-binding dehydrogenase [Spirochaetia bacterium]|jgi:threonine dehydrogenase-like Zn-dependent dehydrogenase
MVTSRYAELVAQRQMALKDEKLECGRDEMLVRITHCGLCQYDGSYFKGIIGTLPQRLGHEPVGVVEQVGKDVAGFNVGDRVTGLFAHLRSFATYCIADPKLAVPVPPGVPSELALGEPLKCISTIARAANPQFGDHVLLIGAGFMGLLVVAALRGSAEGHLIVADINDDRLKLARQCGATETLRSDDPAFLDRVRDLTRGHGIDVAVEVVGLPAPAELAAKTLRRGGRPRYVLAGWHGQPGTFTLRNWTTVGAEIISAHPSYSLDPMEDLRRGMDALARGVFPMEKLVTHRFPLSRVQQGMETMVGGTPGYIKGVIEMGRG